MLLIVGSVELSEKLFGTPKHFVWPKIGHPARDSSLHLYFMMIRRHQEGAVMAALNRNTIITMPTRNLLALIKRPSLQVEPVRIYR